MIRDFFTTIYAKDDLTVAYAYVSDKLIYELRINEKSVLLSDTEMGDLIRAVESGDN